MEFVGICLITNNVVDQYVIKYGGGITIFCIFICRNRKRFNPLLSGLKFQISSFFECHNVGRTEEKQWNKVRSGKK